MAIGEIIRGIERNSTANNSLLSIREREEALSSFCRILGMGWPTTGFQLLCWARKKNRGSFSETEIMA
jgi:hypothetical protein